MRIKWSAPLAEMRALGAQKKAGALRTFISKECGPPLSVRDARKQLYLITVGALAGRPRLIAVGDDQAILMSLSDLDEVLLDLSLMRFVDGLNRLPRKKVQNR